MNKKENNNKTIFYKKSFLITLTKYKQKGITFKIILCKYKNNGTSR